MNTTATLLCDCLQESLSNEQWRWFESRRRLLNTDTSDQALHVTLGMIPRKMGRASISWTPTLEQTALTLCPDTRLSHWSVDTAARALVINDLANSGRHDFANTYANLCRTADLNEQISLYRATSLFEPDDALDTALGEGLRTSIQAVFEAIAHHNPYPQKAFDTHRWNHMVLKALFIDSTLHPIVGLEERSNPELAIILCDYAHERWAAGRAVTAELWRCVGPFATRDEQLADLHRALEDATPGSTQGALLALVNCPHPDALPEPLREKHSRTLADIGREKLTWDSWYKTYV